MDQQSRSLWMEIPLVTFSPLQHDLETDVCIVGGGIAGLTCAYTLVKQGKKVVVIEKSPQLCGQSIRTTAHVTWALDDHFYELKRLFGVEWAKLAAESHSAAIDYIEKIVRHENIDCDFERVDGYLFLAPGDPIEILNNEHDAIKSLEKEVVFLSQAPIATFDMGPCLQFPEQAQLHISKYLNGLAKYITANGGNIYSNTEAQSFKDGKPCKVITATGATITAKSLIIATCTPINDRVIMQTKQAAYRTYVIGALVEKNKIPKGLFWDSSDPYHYVRLHPHQTDTTKEWLIVGGEDHKVGQDSLGDSRFDLLEAWTKSRFPIDQVIYRWSGQIFEPADALAYIGRNPTNEHTYIVTGDSGNGITHGTIAGMLIPDLISGKQNPWENIYHPSRKTLEAASEYLKENLNTANQYLDWLTPGEQETIKDLQAGEGMILRKGIKKLAVYKNNEGKVYVNSAFCTHLGGCVRWNSVEKSWDCPCHGSRFNSLGEVITGPANAPLFSCQESLNTLE